MLLNYSILIGEKLKIKYNINNKIRSHTFYKIYFINDRYA